MTKVNIIIPVLNEAKNLQELITRIGNRFKKSKLSYKITVVDDHSTDNTKEVLRKLSDIYPITILTKRGKTGKAYSILEGIEHSDAKYIAMIDGDLQYAPEYIPQMVHKADKENLGVVIGNRTVHHESRARQFISKVGHLIYAKLVLGLNFDTQSGLKVFKKQIAEHLTEHDVKPWAFDLPLLYTALETGEEIGSVDIDFEGRRFGKSKVSFLKTTLQILSTAFHLRMGSRKVFHIASNEKGSMLGAGLFYKRKKFVTHTTLHHSKSALITFTFLQKTVIFTILGLIIGGLFINSRATEIGFIAVLSLIYFLDVFFGLFLVLKSLHYPPELDFSQKRLDRVTGEYLPVYSILCPLYREAEVLPQFVKNISKLDWPKDRLDVMLLLEEDDAETIEAAKKMNLPGCFRILIVPHSFPKTKPKACNYGLNHAKGEYIVIYDAEDAPEPEQLKKAFLGFMDSPMDVFCLQAKLNYYNPNQNILTRLFTAEYSLWFDIVLPGLQSIETSIPLGGTSNHFRTAELKKLEGWDPFNVAEDADLGARLFRAGYKTAIIDSVTLEEANSNVKNWIRQRSRWLKGYMQTYFVQMRQPLKFAREKKQHYLIFQLVNGLRITFMLINPFLWAMTLAYFLLFKFVGPQIEALYPAPVFYMAVFSAVFGNFLYLYYYMIGAARREQWGIIKYVFLVPFYWLLTSVGAFLALYQLIVKPHFWEKTVHGLVKAEAAEKRAVKRIEFGFLKNMGFPAQGLIKKYASSGYISGALLIAASMFANFLNFLYNAYLGRTLTIQDFGLVSLMGSFIYISQIPISAISRTVTYRSAYLLGKFNTTVSSFWRNMRTKSIKISFVAVILWLILTPILPGVFKSNTILPFLLFTPVWIIGFAGAVDGGYLSGNMKFGLTGLMAIAEALAKLILTIVVVKLGHPTWVYAVIPASMLASFTMGYLASKKLKQTAEVDEKISNIFPMKFFGTSVLSKISSIAFLSLDLVVVKIFLSPVEAGIYALLSLVGKMVYLVGSQFSQFIIPIVSKNEGSGEDSERPFYKLLVATIAISFLGFLGVGILGKFVVPILLGSRADAVVPYLILYTAAMAIQVIIQAVISFHQVKSRHSFPILGFLVSVIPIAGIAFLHQGIGEVVDVIFIGSVLGMAAIFILHIYYDRITVVARNIVDFFGIFQAKQPVAETNPSGLPRVLIFNWRDTKHVWSGGAEVYIHEIAKRLVAKGHKVTIFCGNDGKNPRNEKVDGVQIIRRGGFYTVYVWAFLYYVLRFREYFDVIIDSENGIPFFTPLYSKKKVFLLIHHVHQDLFRIKLRPPLSYIGKFLEKEVMPRVYQNTEVITVSPSSKADILEHKITDKEPHVVYNGVDTNVYKPGVKSKSPMVLYLGRLTPQKSLSVFIKSAKKILRKMPKVEFVIAGDGVDKKKLIKLAKSLGLQKKITFTGKVTEAEKVKLYQKAWIFMNPSLMEGWGITTIEANACGTPVIASNVAGLRDAVHNPHSGLLVPYGDVNEFTKNTISLLTDQDARKRMSKESIVWAKKFDWNKSTDELKDLL